MPRLPPAQDALAPDLVVHLEDHHAGPVGGCVGGAGHASRTGADDDHVRLVVPGDLRGHHVVVSRERAGDRADAHEPRRGAGHSGRAEEAPPSHALILARLVGVLQVPIVSHL